jgi:hypothetical protein
VITSARDCTGIALQAKTLLHPSVLQLKQITQYIWGANYTLLAAVFFGFVFSFGLGAGLPLHVAGTVGPAAFQRDHMVNNPIFTPSCSFPSRRAGMRALELVLCVIGTKDSAARVPGARLAPLSGEARKTQDEHKN